MPLLSFKHKITFCVISLLMLCIAYSNHFNNPFEFDDEHTIVNNAAIRSLKNIPSFYLDATTTSTLPKSQAYRPGLTTLNAIDFAIGGKEKPEPFYYHLSIFISLIALGFSIFYFCKFLFKNYFDERLNFFSSIITSTFFCIHTANTQTINYIISRDDSFSTLMVMIAFLIYFYSLKAKKFHLYLLPMIFGFLVKEPAIMFAPLLMVYKLLFEPQNNEKSIFRFSNLKSAFFSALPAFFTALVLFIFSQSMTPKTWTSGNIDRWNYLISQPYVFIHYFNNFFLPFNLVIDTDWDFVKSITDDRFIIGLGFVITLLYFTIVNSKKHPIVSFALSWFLLALLPSSSIIPLSEVLNDHRPFFAYIGLSFGLVYLLIQLYLKYKSYKKVKLIFVVSTFVILILHATGTYYQNSIWQTSESLWKAATDKSPKNGRVWMNYGNTLMARGAYSEAEKAFSEAIKNWPDYPYIFVNNAILKSAINKPVEAEKDFLKAIELDNVIPEFYYHYSKFLMKQQRFNEAIKYSELGLQKSPKHADLISLNSDAKNMALNPMYLLEVKIKEALELIKQKPTPENYLELSLAYYNAKDYIACIDACYKALELNPNYALAYNNICTSFNELKLWEKAIETGNKGLSIDPNNELLKGNLNFALSQLNKK